MLRLFEHQPTFVGTCSFALSFVTYLITGSLLTACGVYVALTGVVLLAVWWSRRSRQGQPNEMPQTPDGDVN